MHTIRGTFAETGLEAAFHFSNAEKPCNHKDYRTVVRPGGIEPSAYRLGGGFESNSMLNFNGKSACFQAFSGKQLILRLLLLTLHLP